MPPHPLRRHIIAHWFGCGLVPKAPGTVGTLGALPLHMALLHASPLTHAFAILILAVVGVFAAQAASVAAGKEDPGAVVIDEVAGMLIAGWFTRNHGWLSLAVAFALFRILDITKPSIIDRAQRVGPPGIAIMLDDILAGLGAGIGAWLVGYYV